MITEIEKQNIIKSILNVRCREGSTIADIEGKCGQKPTSVCNIDCVCMWHFSINDYFNGNSHIYLR